MQKRADELRSRSLLRRSFPQSMRRVFVALRQHGWDVHREGAVADLLKRRRQHGRPSPQFHGNAVVFFMLHSF